MQSIAANSVTSTLPGSIGWASKQSKRNAGMLGKIQLSTPPEPQISNIYRSWCSKYGILMYVYGLNIIFEHIKVFL